MSRLEFPTKTQYSTSPGQRSPCIFADSAGIRHSILISRTPSSQTAKKKMILLQSFRLFFIWKKPALIHHLSATYPPLIQKKPILIKSPSICSKCEHSSPIHKKSYEWLVKPLEFQTSKHQLDKNHLKTSYCFINRTDTNYAVLSIIKFFSATYQ